MNESITKHLSKRIDTLESLTTLHTTIIDEMTQLVNEQLLNNTNLEKRLIKLEEISKVYKNHLKESGIFI